MSDIPGGETICILKGVFECNLMEWKPQYLFEYTNSTVRLISDDCFFIFICTFFFYCFAFPFAQSGLKDFTFTCCFIFGSETQAGCSSVVGLFCYFILFYFFYFVGLERRLCCCWPALCLLLQLFRRTRSRGGEELGVFVLFLVQYAVHKSLALEIIRLFSSSFFFLSLFNGYIAVFLSFFFFGFSLKIYEQVRRFGSRCIYLHVSFPQTGQTSQSHGGSSLVAFRDDLIKF